MTTKLNFSAGYRQLADVFECLENSGLQPQADFGEDVTGTFAWFLSPQAVALLNRKNLSSWLFLKHNSQFRVKSIPWQGIEGLGVNLHLNI